MALLRYIRYLLRDGIMTASDLQKLTAKAVEKGV